MGVCQSVKDGEDQLGKLEFVWGRASHDELNVVLQLLLDRGCNWRKLFRERLLVCAGNAETDSGTTELNVPYDTARAVVFGLAGSAAGREYLYYCEEFSEFPTFEQIDQNPMKVPLPKPHNVSIHYALGEELPKGLLIEDAENPGVFTEADPKLTDAVSKYFRRRANEAPTLPGDY